MKDIFLQQDCLSLEHFFVYNGLATWWFSAMNILVIISFMNAKLMLLPKNVCLFSLAYNTQGATKQTGDSQVAVLRKMLSRHRDNFYRRRNRCEYHIWNNQSRLEFLMKIDRTWAVLYSSKGFDCISRDLLDAMLHAYAA